MSQIKILKVIEEEITIPKSDGQRGSGLYMIPLQLSGTPSSTWAEIFRQEWDHPDHFTSMHRPGIAVVVNDRIILNGTTIEELEQYHRDTLLAIIQKVNRIVEDQEKISTSKDEAKSKERLEHRKKIHEISSRIKFG